MPNHHTQRESSRPLLFIAREKITRLLLLPNCKAAIIALALASLVANSAPALAEPRVLFETSMGDIEIDLHPDVAPGHVQNFLNYVNHGDYDNSFIHRSINDFVIQGGGFIYSAPSFYRVQTDPPITNEFAMSNLRGTVAMAKLGDDPNSATSQWFINLADNSANLDAQNGGFTVFGTVVQGMDIVDAIASLPVGTITFTPQGEAEPVQLSPVPLRNLPPADPIVWQDHLVMIDSATQTTPFEIPVLPQPFIWLLAAALGLAAGGGYHHRASRALAKG